MDKYYELTPDTKAEDIVEDFLTEEALETANAMEEDGWQCLGVFPLKDFVDGKYREEEFAWLDDME